MVGPDFKTPESKAPVKWTSEDHKLINSSSDRHEAWWENFNDPALNALIQEAYASNLSLKIAGLRIFQARALLGKTEGSLYPQSQALRANASHIELSRNADPISNFPNSTANNIDDSFQNIGFGIDAFWELDFFGKIRRGIQAGEANLTGTIANYDDALVSLTGDIATTYILFRTIEERLKVTEKNVKLQKRSLEISEIKFKNGITSELDVQQAKTLLTNTLSLIPALDLSLAKTKNALSLLLGRTPGDLSDILNKSQLIPTIPDAINAEIPGELLRRRPDVRKAELLAAAQCAKIGIVKADLYPSFRLMGSIGYVAESDNSLVSSNSVSGVGAFGVMWNFLNYGRIKNNIRMEDAKFQQAITTYQLTVLAAAKEVDDSLTGFVKTKKEAEYKEQSEKSAKRASELALKLYKDGLTSYTTVIDTQRVMLLQQDSYIAAKGRVGLNLIAAYKAMGGGWQLKIGKDYLDESTKDEMSERTDWGELMNIKDIHKKEKLD